MEENKFKGMNNVIAILSLISGNGKCLRAGGVAFSPKHSELWKYQFNHFMQLTQKGEREHLSLHKRCETLFKDAIFTKLVLQTAKLGKEGKTAIIDYQTSK